MNPWEVVRREIGGAIRSLRYDLVNRRTRLALDEPTEELPVITSGDARRQRVIFATTTALVVTGAVSGYLVLTGGLDSLLTRGTPPAALPPGKAKPGPQTSPTPRAVSPVKVPAALNSTARPRTAAPRITPSISPPVPTPAPTCSCVTPSPTPSASLGASPLPSGSSTEPTHAPTSAATR